MTKAQASTEVEPGTFRRFGKFGPIYEIVRATRKRNARGELLFEILVPETGERAEYSESRILADPKAA
ncbi:MAG: DUF5397 family protein [Thermomonas sp.]|uniref:DUF5397 family protein n=1 Tax=Thermomonas sp. TaxID=1971895 RepID=UPI0039E72742